MLLAVIFAVVLVSVAVMAGVVDVKVYSTINLKTNFGN